MKKTVFLLLIVFNSLCCIAQTKTDSIQKLDEVVLSDVKLKQYTSGFKISVLNDSILKKNATSLTGLLAFNSNIYFKENGFGMVSSPSFRGTNASQTAVIWNGISINSQLNGQTDFNLINTTNYNSITIRSGGGSVQYGSGAIGGSIHLNNKLSFYSHFDNNIRLSYGSFDTKKSNYTSSFGNNKWSANLGVAYVESENDYKYLGTSKLNENGAFNNLDFNVNLGYFISEKDVLKLYHQSFLGERYLSGTIVALSKSKYEDENFRSMLEWNRNDGKINSKFKVAHLQENFRYFENKEKDNFSFGKVNTILLNHSLNVRFSEKLRLKTIIEYTKYEGEGSSFGRPRRSNFSATALLNHKLSNKLSYSLNLRKDFSSEFETPFVFSIDVGYDVTQHCKLLMNGSKNYRVPTFNDLYWKPGGNLDLVPESSYQIDFGQQLHYKWFSFKLNGYYINTRDLIQWKPDNTGVWRPINIAETENYGLEAELAIQKKFNQHHFELKGNYSYTVSEDKATKKQLIYVPFHKANTTLAYSFRLFSLFYQHLFNDEVFINGNDLDAYDVGNLGLGYALNMKRKINYQLDFKINNIYNRYYENVALRPMPNRNFNLQLTIKF